ncbi:MAG TPA: sulfatase-like hydrolase/transferase [Candidatus Acidoferrum sp.]|nr:sulfatase-like hydrolase/transferase [Candidatus Acidoferrum sp.]
MNTRRLASLATAALNLVSVCAAASATNAPTRPHILVILADELRADCLGASGNREVQTPHLDALAAEGFRFNNFFCALPVCTPSRYSILTGLPVHEHRGWGNHCTLTPGTATFPALLRQAGYRTKAVGKMHFTPTYADFGLSELELAEQNGPGRWDDDYHRFLRRIGLFDANDLEDQEGGFRRNARPEYWTNFGALPSNLDERDDSTTWIGDRAAQTLEQWDPAAPALLMVGFIKPHHPFDPPASWARKYDPQKVSLLPGWAPGVSATDLALGKGYFDNTTLTEAGVRRCTAYYYATISELDFQVGRMISVLKKKGLFDSTLIVFTADHGEYLGFHHLLLKGNLMYDPLARVPLIIHPPTGHGPGAVRDELFSNTDLAPTILQAAGVPRAAAMQGQDLLKSPAGHDIVFCESGDGYIMARTRAHKLLWRRASEERLFFDLAADPLELTNRIHDAKSKAEITRLTRAVEAWRPGPVTPAYVDENAAQIAQPNVPSSGQRQDQRDWFREQMQQWQSRSEGR